MHGLHQIDVKVFATRGSKIAPYDFVRVLQRWIQNHTLPGVLVDVADYSHMHHGPGVILVAHEHNVSVDYGGGRMGLLYHRKTPMDGIFQERVKLAVKYALMAADELENEPEFKGKLAFDAANLLIIANDRLHAPHDATTYEQFREQVYEAVNGLYDCEVSYEPRHADPRQRLAIEVKSSQAADLREVIARCSGAAVS